MNIVEDLYDVYLDKREGYKRHGVHKQQFPGLLLLSQAAQLVHCMKPKLLLYYFKGIPSLSGYMLFQKHNE